ncbi:hypothetical protein [Corynebacterium sp. HMSC05C01]|uniref:hypothetical protein n=1 Tax=Corynebacterium sp. HMSC05C01 TaxID=1581113 RepID=UPI00143C9685|nr:hypothetical protein [Corynebacterium sp. HMSC05C01]
MSSADCSYLREARGTLPQKRSDVPAPEHRNDPRQAVRDALDEELRSRPTTVWQAFWEGFKRA